MKSATTPRRNPRQERSKITVNAILEAAARVWSEQDYARSNTNLIARRAGVSIGSLYQYFPNKTALLCALNEQRHALLMTRLTEACQAGAPTLEMSLRAIISAAAEHHREHAALERVFACQLPQGPRSTRVSSQVFQAALRNLLTVHQAELRIKDPNLALFFLQNLGRSIMHSASRERLSDLKNGVIVEELLATALAFLTGRAGDGSSPKKA